MQDSTAHAPTKTDVIEAVKQLRCHYDIHVIVDALFLQLSLDERRRLVESICSNHLKLNAKSVVRSLRRRGLCRGFTLVCPKCAAATTYTEEAVAQWGQDSGDNCESDSQVGDYDPSVHRIADAITGHRKLAAAYGEPLAEAAELFSLWPPFQVIEPALAAIAEAGMDTPAGEAPSFTMRRVRAYMVAAAKGRRREAQPEHRVATEESIAEWRRKHL